MLFSFVFFPFLLIFIYLSSILAKFIWKRYDKEVEKHKNVPTISGKVKSKEIVERRLKREQRQLRMFKAILWLMTVFIVCRVPNWVIIVFMMSSNPKENIHYVLCFSFGLLSVVNCMLNPILFSFISETIQITSYLSEIFQKGCKGIRGFLKRFFYGKN